ncbi:MAG: hypothetical protein DRP52_01085 [Planctomycetota bacterium]|nr:MAG: hypothetical protein DRP52_01085 [Planctomycetota bacterium]
MSKNTITIIPRPPLNLESLIKVLTAKPSGDYLIKVHQYVITDMKEIRRDNLLTTGKNEKKL